MYTDEKRPDEYVYEVVPVIAVEEPKPKRPVWRRVLRAFLAISLFSMLWSAFVPMPHCEHGVRHPHAPPMAMKGPKLDYKFHPTDNFKIEQVFGSLVPSLVETVGSVILKSHEGPENYVHVHFDITSSDDKVLEQIKITPSKHEIKFSSDPVVLVKQTVNLTITALVPKGGKDERGKLHAMKTFQVLTKGLNIVMDSSFDSMINGTYFETVDGDIVSVGDNKMDVVYSPYFSAKSTTGSLLGRFPLGYTLDLETGSGKIHANVTSAPFKEEDAKLTTIAGTGNTIVKFANDIETRTLKAYHESGTGDISVSYPEAFQGSVKATSLGDVDIVGDSFEEIDRRHTAKGNLLKGIKGTGPSYARLLSVSGKVEAIVGKWTGHRD